MASSATEGERFREQGKNVAGRAAKAPLDGAVCACAGVAAALKVSVFGERHGRRSVRAQRAPIKRQYCVAVHIDTDGARGPCVPVGRGNGHSLGFLDRMSRGDTFGQHPYRPIARLKVLWSEQIGDGQSVMYVDAGDSFACTLGSL